VYHEHLSYFSVSSLKTLLERLGMRIIDAEKTQSHGGSLRVFAARENARRATGDGVSKLLDGERAAGLHALSVYEDFARRVERNKGALRALLKQIKAGGKTVAGYGAPAKGNTLLNYCSIGPETLDYIVDDSAWKQGLFTPGTHIEVAAAERLMRDTPDYILILAWNFAEPIMKKLAWFSAAGGRCILPVPVPRVV